MNCNVEKMVQQALTDPELGQLVAVRWTATGAVSGDLLVHQAAAAVEQIRGWLSDEVLGVRALRAENQLALLVSFVRGGTALITLASVEQPAARFDLVLWAQRGTLAWQNGDSCGGSQDAFSDAPPELVRQIESALEPPLRAASGVSNPAPMEFAPLKPPYGVLLIAGDHTHQPGYAQAMLEDGRARLVAVADEDDVDPRRRWLNQQLAQRLGIPYLANLEQALGRNDVQVVSLCVEPMRRGRIAVAAAQSGKHLYLDKPLAGTLADAEAIVAAARQHRVASHMFSQIHWPPSSLARDVLASGRLGRITGLHFDLCFAKGAAGTAELRRPRRENAKPAEFELPDAKRELTNVGVYSIVSLLWLLRRPVRRVWANTGNFFFAEHQRRDMEDFGQILLELEDGALATVTAGRTGWQSHPSYGLNRITLVGTRGSTVCDAHLPRLEKWSASASWSPPPIDPEDPMAMWFQPSGSPYQASPKTEWLTAHGIDWQIDVARFFDALESGRSSATSADLAAIATRVLLAAYESAATGRGVELTG